jgi:hypothetical protein
MEIKYELKFVNTIEEYINALEDGYIHVSIACPLPLFFGLDDAHDCECNSDYISKQLKLTRTLRERRNESPIFKYSYVSAMMDTDANGIPFALDGDAALTEAIELADMEFADVGKLLLRLADRFERIGDGVKAVQCYIKASERGDIMAKFYLARCYEKGIGVSQDDLKAAELYLYVAENSDELSLCGDPDDSLFPKCDAEYALGNLYEKNLLPDSTIEKAVEWYLRASKNGSYSAVLKMAEFYLAGKGVTQSYDTSASYFANATEMWDGKDDERIFILAKCLENKGVSVLYQLKICEILYRCYSTGLGTDKDSATAEEYADKINTLKAEQEKEMESWLRKFPGKKQ